MPLVKVASLSQLPANSVTEVIVGNDPYALCNASGRVSALGGVCPHRGGPVGQGAMHNNRVACPWHAWEFDCLTGVNDYDPSKTLPAFRVEIQGDDVMLEIP